MEKLVGDSIRFTLECLYYIQTRHQYGNIFQGHKGSKHRQNEELKRTREAFDELDLNRDGFITEDDVKKVIHI